MAREILKKHRIPIVAEDVAGTKGRRIYFDTAKNEVVVKVIQKTEEGERLDAALALWRYAQESALYIFGDRAADPLEEKILEALKQGPLTATELSAVFCRNISKERLQPILQQLEAQQRIFITKQKNGGRPKLIIALRSISVESVISEKREFSEKKEAVC